MDLISRYRDAKIVAMYDDGHRTHETMGKIEKMWFAQGHASMPRARRPGMFKNFRIKLAAVGKALFSRKKESEQIRGRAIYHRFRKTFGMLCGALEEKAVCRDYMDSKEIALSAVLGYLHELACQAGLTPAPKETADFAMADSVMKFSATDRASIAKGLATLLQKAPDKWDRLSEDQASILKKILVEVGTDWEKWPTPCKKLTE